MDVPRGHFKELERESTRAVAPCAAAGPCSPARPSDTRYSVLAIHPERPPGSPEISGKARFRAPFLKERAIEKEVCAAIRGKGWERMNRRSRTFSSAADRRRTLEARKSTEARPRRIPRCHPGSSFRSPVNDITKDQLPTWCACPAPAKFRKRQAPAYADSF